MSFTSPRTVSSTMLFFRLLFFFFVSLYKVAFGDLIITAPQDLIDFSNKVNSGTSYSGTTVYLGSDLDFDSSLSQQFRPIGNSKCFEGTFNGQGHIIKNLNISSSLQYVGLFGYSNGASISNVVVDKSCSFSSSCSESSSDVGSIAGYCSSTSIGNIVNMASVTFTGSTDNLRIGGIVGRLASPSTARDCVNYGSVTHSGTTSSSYADAIIGGVIGLCSGTSSTNSIQNCANYGTLTHNGASLYLYFGGITGDTWGGTNIIKNCVSAGKVISTTQGSTKNYIGGIVGNIYSGTTVTITHCLWSSDVGCSDAYGYKETPATVTVTDSIIVMLNATTMGELNEYAEGNSWDKWFMLHLNGGTINSLPQDTLVVTQKHFPDPVKEGYTFSFWCTDVECAGIYDPDTTDITSITDLYAGWGVYTATFDFGNGATETKKVFYGEKYGTLPYAGERAGWTFIGWFTGEDGSGDEITSETTVSIADDHALYAHWTINNYTLRFILDNGESDVVETLNYSDPIGYPNDPVREGYSFNGWSENTTTMPGHNLNITAHWTINNYTLRFILNNGESDVVRTLNYSDPIDYPGDPAREGYSFDGWSPKPDTMPAHNLNITAQWTKIYTNVTEYVEIVFDKKDLSEDDVKTIIRKYANDDSFTIENIETVNGETKVIVKFNNREAAKEFVRIINASSDAEDNHIARADFTSETCDSMSPLLLPGLVYLYCNII